MSKFDMNSVIEKYETGKKVVCDAMDTARGISIHPRLNASLNIKSDDDGETYFDGKVRFDKEITLLNIIYAVLAVVAAFAAAAIVVNAIFALFDGKKKCKKASKKSAKKNECETAED